LNYFGAKIQQIVETTATFVANDFDNSRFCWFIIVVSEKNSIFVARFEKYENSIRLSRKYLPLGDGGDDYEADAQRAG